MESKATWEPDSFVFARQSDAKERMNKRTRQDGEGLRVWNLYALCIGFFSSQLPIFSPGWKLSLM